MTTQMLIPLALGAAVNDRANFLAHHPPTRLGKAVTRTLQEMARPQSPTEALTALHRLQRLYLAHAVGVADNALLDRNELPLWRDYAALEATDTQKDLLAGMLVNGDPLRRAPVFFTASDYSRDIAERMVALMLQQGHEVDFWVDDPWFHRRLLLCCDERQATDYAALMAARMEHAHRRLALGASHTHRPVDDPAPPPGVARAFSAAYGGPYLEKAMQLFYTTTRLPTPQAAALDGIPYAEYVDLYFRMCAVDYARIDAAHRVLIAKLDAGKTLRLTNSDGTDLTLDIDGFTFANSLVAKNVPGSEVFSAPNRFGVNGTLVARGRFSPRDTADIVEDITLVFEQGRVIHYAAAKGFDLLQATLDSDEGSRYVGEIGIGTNPVLQRHVVNALLVEKIGGSFHIALGRAYSYKDYLGVPVKLDNGNVSKIHWDITTMLVGKEGRMILDGEAIMEDGKFTDPALAYLNGAG